MNIVTIELKAHCPSWDTKSYGPVPDRCRVILNEDDIKRIFAVEAIERQNEFISRIETHLSEDPLFYVSGNEPPADLNDCPCFVDADMRVSSRLNEEGGASVHLIGISEGANAPDYHSTDDFDIPERYRDDPKGAIAYLASNYGVNETAPTPTMKG